ncbi:MAG: TonB-dependent receptor [Sulfurimonas sp.]|nr:TonB-dependent receptor [Sulfurimonas sp.]
MKKVIAISLVAALSLVAAENAKQLDAVSIIGDNESHANNIIDTSKIQTTGTITNALSLLNNVAGVSVTQGSSFGLYEYATQVNMRGFNKSQIAFLVDGVPLGASATAGGAPINRFVETENLSSVSVHQGSGSLSTPSAAALGGSINYTTALPQGKTSVKVSTTTGSFGAKRLFSRVDTGEFAKDTRAYISVSDTTTNKWKNEGELKREHIDGKVMTKLGEVDMQLNFSYNNRKDHDYLDISKSDYETYGRDYGLNTNWVAYPTSSSNADKEEQTKYNAYNADGWQNARTDTLISMNFRADIGSSELKITPYYHDQSGTGNWAPNYVLNADGSKDKTKQSFRQSEYYTQRYGATLNWNMDIGEHELLAGLWGESGSRQNKRYWYNLKDQNTGLAYDKTPYYENFNRNFDTTSVMAYLQTKLHFLDDNLIIDLGGKSQVTTVTYTDVQNAANSQPAKDSSAPFLPQLGLTYSLNSANQIYTSFAMNYAQLPDSVYTGTTYDPGIQNEESTNIDLGYRFNSNNSAITATIYYVDYQNKIENITAGTGDIFAADTSYAANVGGVTSKGLELSGLYRLNKAWKVSGNYTYTDATYTDDVNGVSLSGKNVPFIPKHMLNLALDFSKNGYIFGLNAKYNNEIYGTRDNSDQIDDYIITNTYIGYRKTLEGSTFRDVSVLMSVDNLLDEDYLATAGAFGATAGTSTYFIGTPRTTSLTVSATF